MSGAAHGAEAVVEVRTPLHDLAPECKVAALIGFVLAVALVPTGTWWPFAPHVALLAAVAFAARTSPGFLLTRLLIEVPFVLFVVVLPFAAEGPEWHGLAIAGLEAAGAILTKATLAVLACGVLQWTTPAPSILAGAERLRVPRALTTIAGFAIRYLQVVLEELRRVQLARTARGDDPRWLWQARAVAQSAGAVAIRCFSRGERVHLAMLARGWDGRMPDLTMAAPARGRAWAAALALPLAAAVATTAGALA